jgi:hypothetical protein
MEGSIEGSTYGQSLFRSVLLVKSRVAGAFLSSGVGRISDRIPAYGSGRICEASGCGTLLSTYNPGNYCSVHDAAKIRRSRP